MNCLICKNPNLIELSKELSKTKNGKTLPRYFHCKVCGFLFLDPSQRLSMENEKKRYLTHQNDVHDLGYQNSVRSLFETVLKKIPTQSLGLDYGSGPGPVMTHLLTKSGYSMEIYDPFFSPTIVMKESRYDFIVACEVIEHFFDPLNEFKKLKSWLKPGGTLAIQTLFWNGQDLHDWHYSRDTTHVSFYSQKNLESIRSQCGYSSFQVMSPPIAIFQT